MAEQRVVLKDKSHLTIARMQAADVGTMEANMSAGLVFQPGNNAQQCGFTGTGRPQQGNHLT
ncbi:hypothetical protein SDC9_179182 [bioreactor metagenome]|uniref:Uncharacterized protein n=1 Tax=bioreactor metagenome TaxID=1076179 RepID=A0A645GYA4_9ZZZZ